MRHPNRKHKPKHHVKGNRTNILRQVKRVSLEVTHGHHYKEENGIEYINRFSRYVTEKFLKRDRKVFKEYEMRLARQKKLNLAIRKKDN